MFERRARAQLLGDRRKHPRTAVVRAQNTFPILARKRLRILRLPTACPTLREARGHPQSARLLRNSLRASARPNDDDDDNKRRMKFEGVYTALVTPFKADGAIDWDAFNKLVEGQITAGVAGIVPVRVSVLIREGPAKLCSLDPTGRTTRAACHPAH